MRPTHSIAAYVLTAAFVLALPGRALAAGPDDGDEKKGTFAGFTLPQQVVTRGERPPMDPVGGFQLSLMGGVQLRGSASGQGGIALAWFRRSTAGLGLELEGAFTQGPSGEVTHALLSIILQSGARSAKLVPYLALGGGIFHAKEQVRDSVGDALEEFGIVASDGTETGPLIALGFGMRFYLSESLSLRADYREFRAITSADGGLFDRLFSLRRIGGFISIDF